MNIDKLTIGEAKKRLQECEKEYKELLDLFGQSSDIEIQNNIKKEINHGYCIVILDKGFMYFGELITDGEFMVIKEPKNIRSYTSGKGLLWHAKNGSQDMILDPYDGIIKAPYQELKHFIPTNKEVW